MIKFNLVLILTIGMCSDLCHAIIVHNIVFNKYDEKINSTEILNLFTCIKDQSPRTLFDCSVACSEQDDCLAFDVKGSMCNLCYYNASSRSHVIQGDLYCKENSEEPSSGKCYLC